MGSSKNSRDSERLAQFSRRFLLSYRWVPTASGDLRFEPVPNATQAQALRACHKDTALQFANAAQIDDDSRRKIKKYKMLGGSVRMLWWFSQLEKVGSVDNLLHAFSWRAFALKWIVSVFRKSLLVVASTSVCWWRS